MAGSYTDGTSKVLSGVYSQINAVSGAGHGGGGGSGGGDGWEPPRPEKPKPEFVAFLSVRQPMYRKKSA